MQLRRTRAKQSELRFSFNLRVRTAALGLLLARWGLSWAASYPAPLIYQPAQTLYLRLDQTGQFNAAALHTAVCEVDPRVPLAGVATLAEIRLRSYSDIILLTRAV